MYNMTLIKIPAIWHSFTFYLTLQVYHVVNPWHACSEKVTVLGLCVSVSLSVHSILISLVQLHIKQELHMY